jgi:hypothetical protein
MLKKTIFLSLTVVIVPAFSMRVTEVPKWVKDATHITVEYLTKNQEFPINDTTTVLDVKNVLESNHGIPVHQQALNPLWKNPLQPGLAYNPGPELPNEITIKQAMKSADTNRFALSLALRKKQGN